MPFKAIAAKFAKPVIKSVGRAVLPGGRPAPVSAATPYVPAAYTPVRGGPGAVPKALPAPKAYPGPAMGGGRLVGSGSTLAAAKAMGGPGAVIHNGVMRGVIDTAGRWFTNSKIASLVRRVGPEAAGLALGVAVTQIYQAVAESHTRGMRRRRKGLSYRDITTTRRTLTRLDRLSALARKPTTRKKTCR